MRLEEESVLVTGAGPGLGRESALLFAENCAQVMVTDIVDADDGEQAVADTVVTASSAAAPAGARDPAPDTASKGSVSVLVRSLAMDLVRYGIRVDAVRPLHGMSPTFFGSTADRVTDRSSEETREGTPIRRGCRSS